MHDATSMNSGSPPETSLVWLRHDLRLEDNPLFFPPHERRSHQLLVMYVLDQRWLTPVDGLRRLGAARLRLLWQSLMNLRGMLLRRGSDLLVRIGDPVEEVLALVHQHDVECLEVSHAPGHEDRQALSHIAQRLPVTTTLYCHAQDQIALGSAENDSGAPVPDTRISEDTCAAHQWEVVSGAGRYAAYRARTPLEGLPYSLPPWPDSAARGFPPLASICTAANRWQPQIPALAALQGGEEPARAQLEALIWHAGLASHEQDSCLPCTPGQPTWLLSPWLTLGCISARRILQVLNERRREIGDDEACQRLVAGLVQRERWQQRLREKEGSESGVGAEKWCGDELHEQETNSEAFVRWREGRSGDARADRAMQVLAHEGWLPCPERRYLAHIWLEGGGDWRLGARWFERCLLDYDVAVTWGEWRRLAGLPV